MRFLHVELRAGAQMLPALVDFYGERLGLPKSERSAFVLGETRLEFVASAGRPFYHFALLAPGNRFDEILA